MSFMKVWTPEDVAKVSVKHASERKEAARVRAKAWRQAHPERVAKTNAQRRASWAAKHGLSGPVEKIWARWSTIRARKRWSGRAFTVTPQELEWPERCPVLGVVLDYSGRCKRTGWSLDRLDSTKGYVTGNVRVLSQRANRLKHDATITDLERLLAWMRQETFNVSCADELY